MRKIEMEMLAAIRRAFAKPNGYSWRKRNTEIHRTEQAVHIYLHGNPLAAITPDGKATVFLETVRRWPTQTTLSRLRALGVNIRQRNWELYIDGKPIHAIPARIYHTNTNIKED